MRKPLEGYENFYEVDSSGQIISKRFMRPLKPFKDKRGYEYVDLFDGISKKRESVHRLVAKHFVSGFEEGLTVNHKDQVKDNNHYTNLEWMTQRENNLHANAVRVAKLDKDSLEVLKEYDAIIDAIADGFKGPEIVHCCKGRLKTHYGFKWKYID